MPLAATRRSRGAAGSGRSASAPCRSHGRWSSRVRSANADQVERGALHAVRRRERSATGRDSCGSPSRQRVLEPAAARRDPRSATCSAEAAAAVALVARPQRDQPAALLLRDRRQAREPAARRRSRRATPAPRRAAASAARPANVHGVIVITRSSDQLRRLPVPVGEVAAECTGRASAPARGARTPGSAPADAAGACASVSPNTIGCTLPKIGGERDAERDQQERRRPGLLAHRGGQDQELAREHAERRHAEDRERAEHQAPADRRADA